MTSSKAVMREQGTLRLRMARC